jgi:hypothetical protein
MSWWLPPPEENNEFDFEKEVNIDVNVDLKFDADVKLDVKKDIKVTQDLDIEGNAAIVIFDAQAFGKDTLTEAIIVTLAVEDTMSMSAGEVGSFVG